jgi:hypothetical protein
MMEGKGEEEEGSKKRGLIWGDSEGILVLGMMAVKALIVATPTNSATDES